MFYDLTHDNETYCTLRTPQDSLPSAAVVAFTATTIASTRGFDEIFPQNPSVVTERRLYRELKEVEPALTAISGSDVRVCIVWTKGGGSVKVFGEWSGWQTGVDLQCTSGERFEAVLGFASHSKGAEYMYKFVVDNNWVTDPEQPMRTTSDGI